jgi:hypothetical protein
MPATDEDIIRNLLHRYTDTVAPDPSIASAVTTRQRRRDRRRRAVPVAAAGAAVATAAAVSITVVPGHPASPRSITKPAPVRAPAIKLTADQRVLYGLSSAAARQSAGSGRYVVMSTQGDDIKDTSVIDSLTGNMWSYQLGTDGSPSGQGYQKGYSPTAAQFAAMPTSPSALAADLITQWDSQNKPNPQVNKMLKRLHVTPKPIVVSDGDKVFQQASDMLWNPLVDPALRSALYKVLADIPGVRVDSTARDSTGQPAIEISRTDDSGLPGGKSDGQTYATYESPATGAVLESTITYPPGSDVTSPQDPTGSGTQVDSTLYLSVTWASKIPSDPY